MLTRFIVLTTQRSGSTWLVEMLNSHPEVICYSEVLLENGSGRPKFGARNLEFFDTYRSSLSPTERESPIDGQLSNYLNRLYSLTDGESAVGFKLMYGQLGAYPSLKQYIVDHRVSVVHLIRENYLDFVISNELAWHTDRYHSRTDDPRAEYRVRIDTASLLQTLEYQEKMIESMRRQWMGAEVPVLEIAYERLRSDQENILRVLDFLAVATTGVTLSSSLQKIVRTQASAVENYQEIVDTLSGSRFEALLE